MNYAQDALWWRLTHPIVRDLASLLTAPSLWHSGRELPIATLLGEHGFRFLLALNEEPHRLPEHLVASRLGHYAENLLAFWFANAPHSQLLARNLPIFSGSQQLGALDFIVALSGSLYHIELTCKYYGSVTGQPETMFGLNPQDKLLAKQQKMQQQLALSQHPDAQATLAQLGIASENLTRVSLIRGMGFTHSGSLPEHTLYPANAWTGTLISQSEQWQSWVADSRFYLFKRSEYLAPARISYAQTISRETAMTLSSGLIAEVVLRPDDFWHEQQRMMLPEK